LEWGQDNLKFPRKDGIEFYRARDGSDAGLLEVSKTGRRVRLDLGNTEMTGAASGHKLHMITQELETLRSANEAAPFPEQGKSRRVPVTPPKTRKTVWYDVQRAHTQSGDFYSAIDANAIVHAEAAQRNFVQTLAKTFAHLTIGLAIFDDNCRSLMSFATDG